MRATNLSELVYKQGQAGITKATVEITFDNRWVWKQIEIVEIVVLPLRCSFC